VYSKKVKKKGGGYVVKQIKKKKGSALSRGRKVLLNANDKIQVRVVAVDALSGQIKFSMQPWQPSSEEEEAEILRESILKKHTIYIHSDFYIVNVVGC